MNLEASSLANGLNSQLLTVSTREHYINFQFQSYLLQNEGLCTQRGPDSQTSWKSIKQGPLQSLEAYRCKKTELGIERHEKLIWIRF